MNKLKKYLIYFSRRLRNPSRQIKNLLITEPNISFDTRRGAFTITNESLTPYERVNIRATLMKRLGVIRPLTSVRIDDLMMGYYDQCLERYLFERINRSMPNEKTCWFRYAQNNKCIGWVDRDATFGFDEKRQFLYKLNQRKNFCKDDKSAEIDKLAEFLERDSNGYIFFRSNNVYEEDGKIMSLYGSIKKKGFSNIESSLIPIILGYSKKTGRYNAISGRHRIAVLRYLRTQGIIKGSLKIKCHLIKYPFESMVYTRPYNGTCKKCDWGGVFDPGTGTHQDFFIQDGIAVMRGRKNKKGGRQKWDKMQPIFKEAVLNRSVIDVGAHRGMYCLKALEYGASHVTALEPNADLADIVHTVRENYVLDDLEIIIGDFYNDDVYDSLIKNKYDTVFLFGIIHHLLRLGIQKGILYSFDELFRRISMFTNYGVIVEFSLPREPSFSLPEIEPHRDAFSQVAFEKALQSNFKYWCNLGRCKYKSGNPFGRFMYYAKDPLQIL